MRLAAWIALTVLAWIAVWLAARVPRMLDARRALRAYKARARGARYKRELYKAYDIHLEGFI